MQSSRGTLGRFIDDPTLYQNITRATASLDSLVTTVSRADGTVGKLLRDDTLYTRLVGITTGADSLVRLLSAGNGLVPKLINDQQMYEHHHKTITDLNAILDDVRKNPSKYTKGLIKVF
jgi:phospholipid/cholesterol/gamma-HCH transport system substrate-binding protein